MAGEARHLNLLNQEQIVSNRDSNLASGFVHNNHMGSGLLMAENFLPIHHSLVQPKTSVNTDSGVTFNLPTNDAAVPRKHPRNSFNNYITPSNTSFSNPSFISDDVLPLVQQYQLNINSIISHHTKKIRLELEEQQKRQARMLVAAIGERVMKKMNDKDEQIQRMGKMNLVLQERVKCLYVENQLWRDLAQTNEATANLLRTNLEQVLLHVSNERLSAGAVEEDVQSCCGSSRSGDHGGGREEEKQEEEASKLAEDEQDKEVDGKGKSKSNRMCRRCAERESCVLLLPCRHFCLCTVCGSSLHHACPVCNSNMNATVHVNMSS